MRNRIISLCLFALILSHCSQKESTENDSSEQYQIGLNILTQNSIMQYEMENDLVDGKIKVVNTDFDTIELKDILSEKDKLIFHFSDQECSECLAKQFEILCELQDSIGIDNAIILSTSKSLRQLSVVYRQNKLKFKLYQIPDYKYFTSKQKDLNRPFYFLSSRDCILHNVHIPDKSMVPLTRIYLRTIGLRLAAKPM